MNYDLHLFKTYEKINKFILKKFGMSWKGFPSMMSLWHCFHLFLRSKYTKLYISSEEINTFCASIHNKKVLLHECVKAYHPLCSCSVSRSPNRKGGGGLPLSSLDQAGYLHQVLMGVYPIQSWPGGYPHPAIQSQWGYPHSVLTGGRVSPSNTLGYPSWPGMGTPILTWEGGTPTVLTKEGYPPSGRMGYSPVSQMGYPCRDLGRGNHPSARWGYPPPASVNRLKILPSLILRMRVVINSKYCEFSQKIIYCPPCCVWRS